ncbi:hypothetical protein, partial [Desulfobacula sp.]|uniref:hypothetical protein n=1 Tax=Desulfobacula sp. TaxID=2593537 RepID=UPI0025BC2463
TSSPLFRRLWRQNKELDRSPHTDQSNYVCLIGARRRSAPRYLEGKDDIFIFSEQNSFIIRPLHNSTGETVSYYKNGITHNKKI